MSILVSLALVVAVVAMGGAGDRATDAAEPERGGTLVLVPGVDTASGRGSMFELDPRSLGFDCERTVYYSYRGPGTGAPRRDARCPIRVGAPYARADTLRPLDDLAAGFAAQVARLDPPITVVTHSQGAWIAWKAIADRDAPRVDTLVMLAPFTESLAEYPTPGESGAGAMTGVWARVVTELGQTIGFNTFDPDRPLARQVQARAGAVQAIFADRLPARVRALAVFARPDLLLIPGGLPDGVTSTCPAWGLHGGLPRDTVALDAAARFFDGRRVTRCPGWVRVLARPAAAFGAPIPDA
jgi:alpha-beta hydrolase superfamily lysophospholipase